MKRFRWLVAGMAIGFALAVGPSCGTSEPCADCEGCCDANQTCQTGDTQSACGVNGVTCVACSPVQTCLAGLCVELTAPDAAFTCTTVTCPAGCCINNVCVRPPQQHNAMCGIGGGPCGACDAGTSCHLDAGTCTGPPCDGCRPSDGGACVPPINQTDTRCGMPGALCSACPTGAECDGGHCVFPPCDSTTCPNGCCDSNDRCQSGVTEAACGGGAGSCATCAPGTYCDGVNRTCVNTTCGVCSGCCSQATCTSGTEHGSCGKNGRTCRPCGSQQLCVNGECVNNCNSGNCLGCCTANGLCLSGNQTLNCGVGGNPCAECTAGQNCVNGNCL